MIDIYLSHAGQVPVYQQIVQQLQQLIAANKLKAGERLPAVRQLARSLDINPGTVAKSYQLLERQGVVMSRRGGGTTVAHGVDSPQLLMLRQCRLSNIVSSGILEALSLGYRPEELEAAFSLHLAHWREEQERVIAEGSDIEKRGLPDARNMLVIVGSHDLALNLLVEKVRQRLPEVDIEIINSGSLAGLIALREGKADIAGIHLLDEETKEYNYPYVKRILLGYETAIVHLASRVQGLIIARGNPMQIRELSDLSRPDVTMVNRQKGSGTRVLLDLALQDMGIAPAEIRGYREEVTTHIAVASRVARGIADVGLGIEAAARSYDLEFSPLFKERYDLVIPLEKYQREPVAALLEIATSSEFKKIVTEMGGYDTSETGALAFTR